MQGRRFYVPMLAYEQFSSVAKTPQVNEVMAFLVAMNLASSRIGEDHFGGFEYRGPDIDKGERERLYGRYSHEFGLQDATVSIYKLELGVRTCSFDVDLQEFVQGTRVAFLTRNPKIQFCEPCSPTICERHIVWLTCG